jgi:hypothetical protein
VAALVLAPSTSASSTFSPSAAQRDALRHGSLITQPPPCSPGSLSGAGSSSGAGPVTVVSANDDGTVYVAHPGDRVAIFFYEQYPPSFSSGVPLCSSGAAARTLAATAPDGSGASRPPLQVEYLARATGTGFVYFPEPGGWAYVARIDVVDGRDVLVALVVVAAIVFVVDVVLGVRVRRSQRSQGFQR